MKPFDLHLHSCCSDGTDSPEQIVALAARLGLGAMALTDHDTMSGAQDAVLAGERHGVRALAGVELDQDWPYELHILGLGVSPSSDPLREALEQAKARRKLRNQEITERLLSLGWDVTPWLPAGENRSRMHFAWALVHAGAVKNTSEAFAQYLSPGRPGYAAMPRFTPRQSMELIHQAGGAAVLAHPCHIRANIHALVHDLVQWGLDGIEIYYPGTAPGQTALFESLAAQYGLLATCGSDYHGGNRPGVEPGCTWRDVPALERTAAYFHLP